MRGATTAKYLFAACLCASTVDLLVVNFVVGPLAIAATPTPEAFPLVAASGEAPPALASATPASPTAPLATAAPAAPGTAPMVVARFEIDQPTANWDDLAFLAATMKADPQRRVVLEGHTDRKGDRAYNRTLSFERARWAQARLVELGVNASRVEVIAHGAEQPLPDGAERGTDLNRRVEARWLPSAPDDGDR